LSFRKEKKFRLTIFDFHKFKHNLFQEGMVKLHENRTINSIYYDTVDLKMFHESEEGLLPRKKIRVRHYNKIPAFTLETKTSSIEGRYKTSKKLDSINTKKELLSQHYFDKQYGILYPSLYVSYERSYFKLQNMRITFDEKIIYQNMKDINKYRYNDPERVIEIKTPIDCSDDYLEKYIPYSTARFSKYARGLLLSIGDLSEN
jgi:hypothetical protein